MRHVQANFLKFALLSGVLALWSLSISYAEFTPASGHSELPAASENTVPAIYVSGITYTPPGCGAPPPPGAPAPDCPSVLTVTFQIHAIENCLESKDFSLQLMTSEGQDAFLTVNQISGFDCVISAFGSRQRIQVGLTGTALPLRKTHLIVSNPVPVEVRPRP